MGFRWYITNVIMLAMAVAWLVPFFSIYWLGSHYVQEPVIAILLTEIALFIAIVGLALFNLIQGVRRWKYDKRRLRQAEGPG